MLLPALQIRTHVPSVALDPIQHLNVASRVLSGHLALIRDLPPSGVRGALPLPVRNNEHMLAS